MFNPCSNHPTSSRTTFAVTGVGYRAMSANASVAVFCAGRSLFGGAVLTNDPSGGPGM
jgi:hypothetical protein